jgi:hypothetical protein
MEPLNPVLYKWWTSNVFSPMHFQHLHMKSSSYHDVPYFTVQGTQRRGTQNNKCIFEPTLPQWPLKPTLNSMVSSSMTSYGNSISISRKHFALKRCKKTPPTPPPPAHPSSPELMKPLYNTRENREYNRGLGHWPVDYSIYCGNCL